MDPSAVIQLTKILILASLSGGYRGADSVGQLHTDYPANTYILPMISASMFSEKFYLILREGAMRSRDVQRHDSPYRDAERPPASSIAHPLMKERH
jgi:hypothetical protein